MVVRRSLRRLSPVWRWSTSDPTVATWLRSRRVWWSLVLPPR